MSWGTRAIGSWVPSDRTASSRRGRLLGGAAFIGVVAALAGNPHRAGAACLGENTANVLCNGANQATGGTLTTTFAGSTLVNVDPGGRIDTGGAKATVTAAGDLIFNHNDTTFGITNAGDAVTLSNAFGGTTYLGNANVTSTGAKGIVASAALAGDLSITNNATVTASVFGIQADHSGTGRIQITNDGTVQSGGGIRPIHTGIGPAAGTNGIVVTGSGTAEGGIVARIDNAANASNILIDYSGKVLSNQAINATTIGTGNVEVIVANTITASATAAIFALQDNNAAGTNGSVRVGGTGHLSALGGVLATGITASILQLTNSGNVLVDFTGTVTSGGSGVRATNAGQGDATVIGTGNVIAADGKGIVADAAGVGNALVAPAGTVSASTTGIGAFAIGPGSATVNVPKDVTATAGFGIHSFVQDGPLTVTVTGGTTQGGTNGIEAKSFGAGSINVAIAAGAAVKGVTGIGVNVDGGTTNTIANGGAITGVLGAQTTAGSTTFTNAGGITGTGGVAVQLGGANNLFVMDGPAAALTGAAIGSGTDLFRFAGAGQNTFDVSQIGAGWTQLEKTGASIWTLTGNATYAGPTTVHEGALLVNGSLASSSNVQVNPGATIGGNGIVPTTTIIGGTLSPGNSVGTITVNGTLTFVGAGNYLVEVANGADRTNVTGAATLTGTVQAVFLPGFVQQSYTILSAAGGRNGTFNSVTSSLPGLQPELTYTPTDVILSFTAVLGQGDLFNINQTNVVVALNDYFNGGGALPPAFLNVFALTGDALANALTQLSGEIATGAATAGFRATDQFLGLMLDPFLENRAGGAAAGIGGPALAFAQEDGQAGDALAYAKGMPRKAPPAAPTFDQRWTVWGAGYGAHSSFNGEPVVIGSHDLNATTAGIAGGVDYRAGNAVIGAAVTGQSLSYRLDAALGSGSGDAVQAGLYGSTKWGNAYVSAALSLGWYELETDRTIILPGITDRLTADFSARSIGGRIEGGWRLPVLQSSGVTPYAALQAISFHTGAYTEVDAAGLAAFALAYGPNATQDLRSELGLRVDTRMTLNETSMLILRGRAAWAHSYYPGRHIDGLFVNLPGAGFTVFGATPDENSALVSAGGELRLANGFSLLAKFDGEFGSDTTVYAGTGTLRYAW